jgi:catechol 2,3-dioxygenase-like lactoylglutathione lyase family enzyme
MTAIAGLHHVQLSGPAGCEEDARAFYGLVLGVPEVAKPAALAARGGVWFRSDAVEIHIGVDPDFAPQKKAHPGLLVDDLDGMAKRIEDAGGEVEWDELFPGFRRCYARDPFGNRLELLEPLDS